MAKTTGSSGMGFLGRPGQTERSIGGIVSDVKKPLLIALLAGPVAGFGCGLLYLVLWLVWKRTDPWAARRFFESWQEVLIAIPLTLWALAFSMLFVTWLVENWNKHWPPAYGPANPDNGLMGPLWGVIRAFQTLRKPDAAATKQYASLFSGASDALRDFVEETVRELGDES